MNRWKTKRTQRRRWQVERVRYRCWITGGIIFGEGWQVTAPDGYVIHTEYTWCEAMDYADKMARTITFTLPRIGDRHTVSPYPETDPLMVSAWGTGAGISTGQSDTEILIMRRELKPLALALLAHHYKQELQK